MANQSQLYVSTSAPFYWAAETMAIAAGMMNSRLDRNQLPLPRWLIIDTFRQKATFSYVNSPPASVGGSAAIATSTTQVTTAIDVVLAAEAEEAGPSPEPPPPVINTFGNITGEFGAITQTFGEL